MTDHYDKRALAIENLAAAMAEDRSVPQVAAGLRARAAGARLRSRLLRDLAEAEERQADALTQYADTLDPS